MLKEQEVGEYRGYMKPVRSVCCVRMAGGGRKRTSLSCRGGVGVGGSSCVSGLVA